MIVLRRFSQLSSSVRISLIVMLLMAAVSLTLSERVLSRLSENQQSYLEGLANSYLGGVAASVSPSVLRRDSWEIYDTLLRMKPEKVSVLPLETIVTTPDDITLASDLPNRFPTFQPVRSEFLSEFSDDQMQLNTQSELGFQMRPIMLRGDTIGKVYVVFDASSLLEERREVLLALLLTNGALTILFAGIGFLMVRRMVGPMQVLENHLQTATSGGLERIAEHEFPKASRDARRMFSAFNTLVDAEREREMLVDRLGKEERMGSLGRLASGMAHEINNPLGGLLNATDTLDKHGHHEKARAESVTLIRRGLLGIRDIVLAALTTYRLEKGARPFSSQDLDDIALLLRPELKGRAQTLRIKRPDHKPDQKGDYGHLPAAALRQALLNLLLNASKASSQGATIDLKMTEVQGYFLIEIFDQGEGLPEEARQLIEASLASSVPKGSSGLGLWVVRQIADELDGILSVRPNEPTGSVVSMKVPAYRKEALNAAA